MSMDHSYRVFETQPLQAERDSMRADRSGLENAARRARAAWDDYSRLRRSSCRTGDPAAACTAWMRVDRVLADGEHLVSGTSPVGTAAVRTGLVSGAGGGDWR
jgi:hypothetical protein